MSQSKFGSLIEAVAHTCIGYVLSLCVQLIVYPLYGASFTFVQNLEIGLIFMVVSLGRGYVIRRWFEDRIHRAVVKLAGSNG